MHKIILKQDKLRSNSKQLVLLKKGIDSDRKINLCYDRDTEVEYYISNNTIQMRVNTDGSPYTLHHVDVFQDSLPYIKIGSIVLFLLLLIALVFELFKQYYITIFMWLLFFAVAAYIVYKLLSTMKEDMKKLPDKARSIWKPEIWGGYVLLIIIICFLLFLAHWLGLDDVIKFFINLSK